MRTTAMTFTVGLLTGGAAIYFFLGQGPDTTPALDPPPVSVSTEAVVEPATEPESAPTESELLQTQLDQALAQIAALQAQLEAMKAEMAAKDNNYNRLESDVAQLRRQLADEHAARTAREQPLDPVPHVEAPTPPPEDAPMPPVAVVEPAASEEAQDSERQGKVFNSTGEFMLKSGDAWVGDGENDVFKVIEVAPADDTQLERAEVDSFGERGVVEQGAQVSRMMNSGLHTLIVTRVNGKAGTVELLVQRER